MLREQRRGKNNPSLGERSVSRFVGKRAREEKFRSRGMLSVLVYTKSTTTMKAKPWRLQLCRIVWPPRDFQVVRSWQCLYILVSLPGSCQSLKESVSSRTAKLLFPYFSYLKTKLSFLRRLSICLDGIFAHKSVSSSCIFVVRWFRDLSLILRLQMALGSSLEFLALLIGTLSIASVICIPKYDMGG